MYITPPFRTRVTELLGIKHPLLLGGMHHLSDARYVAAATNAGVLGYLTARSFESLPTLRDELKRCEELTGGRPFGVNITLARRPEQNRLVMGWLEAAFERGVRHFETAGLAPADLVAPIHSIGGTIMHKCSSVQHALTAQRLGVDIIGLVGCEEGGHPGANQLSAFLKAALALEEITVPLVIGGGIGNGAQIAAALAIGAEGVVMGSRFMVATEVWAHSALKQRIVDADENASTTILSSLNDTWRVLNNRTVREIQQLEREGVTSYAEFGDRILSSRTRDRIYVHGDVEDAVVSLGPAGAFADRIEPVEEIVKRLIKGAAENGQAFCSKFTAYDQREV